MRLSRIAAWAVGLLVAVGVAGYLTLGSLLADARLRATLAQALTAALGREVRVAGPLSVHLGRHIRFDVSGIELPSRPGTPGPVLRIGRLGGEVDAVGLVRRRLELGVVEVDEPIVELATDRAGRSNVPDARPVADARTDRRWQWSLAAVHVRRGAAHLAGAGSDVVRASGVELDVGPVRAEAPFDVALRIASLVGRVRADGLAARGRITVDSGSGRVAVEALAGEARLIGVEQGGGRLRFSARRAEYGAPGGRVLGLAVTAAGLDLAVPQLVLAERDGTLEVVGRLSVQPFDPRALAARRGIALPPMQGPRALESAALAADVRASGRSLDLANLTGRLDDSRLTGSAHAQLGRPPTIRIDLTIDRLDADRYRKPRRLRAREAVELPLEALRALPVAGRLRIGELVFAGSRSRAVVLTLEAGRPAPAP